MPLFAQYSDTAARSLLLSMGEPFELQERSFIVPGSKELRLRPPYTDVRPNLFDLETDVVSRTLDKTRLTIIKPDGTTGAWRTYSIAFLDDPPQPTSPFILVIDGDIDGTAWNPQTDILIFYYEQLSTPVYDPVKVHGVYDTVIRENTETTVEVVLQHPNVLLSFKDVNAIEPYEAARSSVLEKTRWDIIRKRTGRVYEIAYLQLDEVSTCRYLLRSID